MTTSGTFNFAPSLGEIVLYAYNLIEIRPTSLVQEHIVSARMATNLLLSDWSNQGVNLWAVDLVTVPLVQGTTTYSVDPSTIMILDAYIETLTPSQTVDRIILPVSRTEYASYPQKTQQGFPTVFWFDRLISPTVTIWPVPDGTQTNLKYYRVRQIQDANFTSGQNVEIPYRWFAPLCFGLAVQLALIFKPDKVAILAPFADRFYNNSALQDTENVNIYLSPQISGYFRP